MRVYMIYIKHTIQPVVLKQISVLSYETMDAIEPACFTNNLRGFFWFYFLNERRHDILFDCLIVVWDVSIWNITLVMLYYLTISSQLMISDLHDFIAHDNRVKNNIRCECFVNINDLMAECYQISWCQTGWM